MMGNTVEVKADPQRQNVADRVSVIFKTGFSEIKRKGAVTRLYFEIKGLEKEKEKYVHALGVRAWEAHISHPDLAGILVHLKELQIEMNRLKTQYGEHDTQIKDIDASKADLTTKFNQDLDQVEEQIVPHQKRIESINAEKEDNKVQMEELRTKQDHLSQQIREHQQAIQEFDLAEDAGKPSGIQLEQDAIRLIHTQKCEIDCMIPLLISKIEKLKMELARERSVIERLDQDKETIRRDFEQRIKDYNQQIQQLEDKKKQATRQMETYRKEMEPYLYDLGWKVEPLRLEERAFRENYEQLDRLNREVTSRNKLIKEAESLSRAMDRSAWTKFLVVSGGVALLFVGAVFALLH